MRSPLQANLVCVRAVLRKMLVAVFRLRFTVSEPGRKTLEAGGVLLLSNHLSFLDGLLFALASPAPLVAASEPLYSRDHPIARRIIAFLCWLGGHEVVPLDAQHPHGMRALVRRIEAGRNVLLFPEGAISPDGRPLPWQPGWQWIVQRTGCPVVHARISGAHRSRIFGKQGREWWPALHLVIGTPKKGHLMGLKQGEACTREATESVAAEVHP